MTNITHKNIELDKLVLSVDNPRFDVVKDEREAISKMIDEQGNKLIRLAKHIIDYGINPSKSVCVTSISETDKYKVLEGNRRVTVLKILKDSKKVDKKHATFSTRFDKLREAFNKNPIQEVRCVVFPDGETALKWIELEHTGQNEGVGVVEWDAQQKARFDKKVKGTTPLALQAIELMQKSIHTPANIKTELGSLTISNLERLLKDPEVRDVLGLKLEDKSLVAEIEEKEVIKGLSKIADDFLFNDYTVYDIDKKKDRKGYIESFKQKDIPNKRNKTEQPWSFSTGSSRKTVLKTQVKKSLPLSHDRKTLIPRDCIMTISDRRINIIYRELKDLEVEEFVNATAVLFRVFLELSIDSFITEKKGKLFQGINKGTWLSEKTGRVIKYFEDANYLEEHELKGIKVAAENKHSIFSIDTFHSYVHNRLFEPIAKDLKITWDNIQPFIEKLWENIK